MKFLRVFQNVGMAKLLIAVGLLTPQMALSQSRLDPMPPIPQSNLLVERTTVVGFAMDDYKGVYKFQVFSDGRIITIDNKLRSKTLGTLSNESINGLKNEIAKIDKLSHLVIPDAPRCADAPSVRSKVFDHSINKEIIVGENVDCLSYESTDYVAQSLSRWIDSLFSSMTQFANNEAYSDLNKIIEGQEGFGSPVPWPIGEEIYFKLYLKCEAQNNVPNKGYNLYKNSKVDTEYLLVHGAEEILLNDNTDYQRIGSPQELIGGDFKFSINGTVTPRPDGKKVAYLTKKQGNGSSITQIELLCEYL